MTNIGVKKMLDGCLFFVPKTINAWHKNVNLSLLWAGLHIQVNRKQLSLSKA